MPKSSLRNLKEFLVLALRRGFLLDTLCEKRVHLFKDSLNNQHCLQILILKKYSCYKTKIMYISLYPYHNHKTQDERNRIVNKRYA